MRSCFAKVTDNVGPGLRSWRDFNSGGKRGSTTGLGQRHGAAGTRGLGGDRTGEMYLTCEVGEQGGHIRGTWCVISAEAGAHWVSRPFGP